MASSDLVETVGFRSDLVVEFRHTQGLAEHLELSPDKFRSVVFFIGDCELKTVLPANVLTRGLVSHIQSFSTPCLNQFRSRSKG